MVFLFGCNNQNSKILDEWYGEYTLLSSEDKCTLTLREDKTYIINYLDDAYSGNYTYYQADGDIGFKPRTCYIPGDYYPTDGSAKAYGLTLLGGDEFENLPRSFKQFFEDNGESNQYLYVHTFYNSGAYIKYGVTSKNVDVDKDKTYKEIVYYPNRILNCTASGEVIDTGQEDYDLSLIKIS